jgi:hypothetical protein
MLQNTIDNRLLKRRKQMTLEMNLQDKILMDRCKEVYKNYGYTIEKDFPKEYYFMMNPETMECVRMYYNGQVEEYHK